MADKEEWRIDKHIPIVGAVLILAQTVGIIWWVSWTASAIEQRVIALESWWKDAKSVTTDVAVMKNEITNIGAILKEIKDELKDQNRKLEKIDESTTSN